MSKLSLSFRITYNGKVREEKLGQTVIKIGKVPSAHLKLDDETVSRMHAIIEVLGNDVSLIDLGSTRGTFVNGHRINKTKLQTGDVITCGDTQIDVSIAAAQELGTPAVTWAPPPAVVTTTATMPPPPMPVAPVAAMPVAPMAITGDEPGAGAIEVATMLGDSVVNVKHVTDPRGGKISRKTWGFIAAGLACLLTSAVAFATSVDEAARNKGALDYWTHVQKRPAHAFRPHTHGLALDYAAFGGLLFGLAGVTLGLARARGEKKSPFFRIGTAPGVEQALETAPAADFPMVAPSGDEFVFNYGAGMDGELTVNGQTTPLADLAATGRARPSATTPGATEVTIPAQARIRVRSGQTTFLVSAVAKPNAGAAAAGFAPMESRTLKYLAGSLAVHLGILAFLQTIPADAGTINVDLGNQEVTDLRAQNIANDETPPPPPDPADTDGEAEGDPAAGGKMALDEGAAGDPKEARVDGHMQVQDNHKEPALSHDDQVEAARTAGILGSTSLEQGINVLGAQQDWTSGFDAVSLNGPIIGADGAGKGVFGGGVSGLGIGGGCSLPPCGIIGTGRYGTIGNGDKAGDGWGGSGGHGGMRNRTSVIPEPTIGRADIDGDLDKSIIKRYIKRSLDKISYCYEKQLLANPNMGGEITIGFYIDPNGVVKSAAGKGFSNEVSSCVAGVISQISFPKPKNGGGVQVNYPFTFRHPAGQ